MVTKHLLLLTVTVLTSALVVPSPKCPTLCIDGITKCGSTTQQWGGYRLLELRGVGANFVLDVMILASRRRSRHNHLVLRHRRARNCVLMGLRNVVRNGEGKWLSDLRSEEGEVGSVGADCVVDVIIRVSQRRSRNHHLVLIRDILPLECCGYSSLFLCFWLWCIWGWLGEVDEGSLGYCIGYWYFVVMECGMWDDILWYMSSLVDTGASSACEDVTFMFCNIGGSFRYQIPMFVTPNHLDCVLLYRFPALLSLNTIFSH